MNKTFFAQHAKETTTAVKLAIPYNRLKCGYSSKGQPVFYILYNSSSIFGGKKLIFIILVYPHISTVMFVGLYCACSQKIILLCYLSCVKIREVQI